MPSQSNEVEKEALLQGTLDLLICTLVLGPRYTVKERALDPAGVGGSFLVDHGLLHLAVATAGEQGLGSRPSGGLGEQSQSAFYTLQQRPRPNLLKKLTSGICIAKPRFPEFSRP